MKAQNSIAGFWSAVWPAIRPEDTELQRRKKRAVRSAQMAVAVMVMAPVTVMIMAGLYRDSALKAVGIAALGLFYVVWSWQGMRRPVHMLFEEPGNTLPLVRTMPARWEATLYFSVQLGLAGLICYQSVYGQQRPIAWLVLLPPVAHSVILLRRWGVAVVSAASLILFLFTVVSGYGWGSVPGALLGFPFALFFTLVFTLLAVSSETTRRDVERLAGELAEANGKLREYAVQAEELAAMRERTRLAAEIHDSLGHYLTVVNVQLEAARALRTSDPDRAASAIEKARALTLDGLQEVRRSVGALRASPLGNRPLSEALRRLVEENRAAGLEVELNVKGQPRPLSPQAELTLYRAAQEGLTNVRKHAQVAAAQLVLDFCSPGKAVLLITDTGVGTSAAKAEGAGFGLMGLRERAQFLGGQVRVRTAPGQGFTLEVEVPA